MAKAVGAQMTAAARGLPVTERQRDGVGRYAELLLTSAGVARAGHGAWGYEFDVQTRWAFYPAGSPNLIATYFVGRGFAEAWASGCLSSGLEEAALSALFISQRLHSADHYTYTLDNDRLVHNANLLGAGFVSSIGLLTGASALMDQALHAARTSIAAQRTDSSWPYGEGSSLGWADNFHTAYNLDGLLQVWLSTGNAEIKSSLDRGVEHWVRDFFGTNGEPKYYPKRAYPYDIHSAGTAVDVAARLASWGYATEGLAEQVAEWTEENLIDPKTGNTYYQKHRWWTDKRHFVRWGDAHWALGRSSLQLLGEGRRDPLEEAIAKASGVGS